MAGQRAMDSMADGVADTDGRGGVPGVSVVVLSSARTDDLADCLTSLAAQQQLSGSLEVVLVVFGTRPFAPDEGGQIRRQHPSLPLRIVSRPGASRTAAREAGIATARCQFLTILDEGDTVGPAFVRALHEAAHPGVVPMIAPAGMATIAIPDEPPGRVLSAGEFSAALAFDGGKLVPAAWARSIRVNHPTGRRADASFWAQLVARRQFSLELCDASPDAAYHRHHTGGHAPGLDELVTDPIATPARDAKLRKVSAAAPSSATIARPAFSIFLAVG